MPTPVQPITHLVPPGTEPDLRTGNHTFGFRPTTPLNEREPNPGHQPTLPASTRAAQVPSVDPRLLKPAGKFI